MKKLLALLLALAMALACAACAQPGGGNGGETATEIVTSVKFPLEEPYTLRMMVKGTVSQEDLEKSTYYQKLVADTNVHIELMPLGEEPTTTLNAMLAAGNYGDVIVGVVTDSMLTDLAYGGFIAPIEDYVKSAELMPNYHNRGLATNPDAIGTMTMPDGHIYSMARLDLDPAAYLESPLCINQNWLDQSGVGDVDTLEHFVEYLRYVRDHDMNGDGSAKDEIPLLLSTSNGNPYSTVQACLAMWGLATKDSALDSYCVVKNGKVSLAPTMDAYKEAIRNIASWYKEGLIWTELYTSNIESFNARLNNKEIPQWGAVFNCSGVSATNPYVDDIKPVMYPKIEGYEPCAYLNPGYNGYKNTFTVTKNCEHPEIALAWLDQLYSQEGVVAYYYGLESDKDIPGYVPVYETNEDGSINVFTLTSEENDSNAKLNTKLGAMLGSYLYLRSEEDYAAGRVWLTGLTKNRHSTYELYSDVINKEIWPRPYYTSEVNEEIGDLRTDVYSIIQTYEAQWVTGQSDIDADWDTYMTKLNNAGVERLTELLQSAYDTWYEANHQ